jgi:hypothetical protein
MVPSKAKGVDPAVQALQPLPAIPPDGLIFQWQPILGKLGEHSDERLREWKGEKGKRAASSEELGTEKLMVEKKGLFHNIQECAEKPLLNIHAGNIGLHQMDGLKIRKNFCTYIYI